MVCTAANERYSGVDGVALKLIRPKGDALRIGLVPEDRKQQGLILSMPVDQNVSLANLESLESAGLLSHRRERMLAQHYVEQFAIKTPTLIQQVRTLSGEINRRLFFRRCFRVRKDPDVG